MPMLLILLFSFIFGTIIGSFLNVVAYRYNTGRTVMGRSACPACGKTLNAFELIPIFGYFFLGGKCGKCKSSISIQYPLVEFATGVLFALVAYISRTQLVVDLVHVGQLLLLQWSVLSVLMVVVIYDIRHKIIPDGLAVTFALLGLLKLVLMYGVGGLLHMPGFFDLLAGPFLAAPFALLWWVSGGRWIGLGDAKLAVGIGWFLGMIEGISAIILAFWIGAFFSIIILAYERFKGKHHLTMKSEIPFGPFLVLGLLVILVMGWDVMHLRDLMQLINL